MIAVISCHATEPEDTHQVRIEVNEKADIDKVIEACHLAIEAFTDAKTPEQAMKDAADKVNSLLNA